jgi:superfamily I DNA and/or RNA helicase
VLKDMRLKNVSQGCKLNFFIARFSIQHPEICAFPSKVFYDKKLETRPSRLWNKELLPFWPKRKDTGRPIPHVLVDVQGKEETLTVSTEEGNERSKSNLLEVEKVVRINNYD